MGANANKLKSLSLGAERKVQCYIRYFINVYVFYTKQYGETRKTYSHEEFKVDYYRKF